MEGAGKHRLWLAGAAAAWGLSEESPSCIGEVNISMKLHRRRWCGDDSTGCRRLERPAPTKTCRIFPAFRSAAAATKTTP
eukprot:scaffold1828_cov136-Isochrysis_galbana.AAC.1